MTAPQRTFPQAPQPAEPVQPPRPSPQDDAPPPPRQHRRIGRLVLVLLVLLVAGGGIALWRVRGPAAPSAPAVPVAERPVELTALEVTAVAPRALTETVRLSGSVSPMEQSAVKAEVAARLAEVLVREGQAVRRGDVLARFDTVELTARLNEKQANLEGARAQLVLAEKTLTKNRTLNRSNIVSDTSLDQAESSFGFQRAQVDALAAQVELARKALRDAVVVSPIDGMVATRSVNPGENLAVNAAMFTIVDLSRVEVEATVPAEQVARLAVGQTAALRVEGFGEREFAGRVARINPMARTGSRAIPVYVTIDNRDGALRGGMFASGEVLVAQAANAIAVPPVAVRHDDQGDFVLVIADGHTVRQPVTRVAQWARGDLVQVEGLAPGDRVVTGNLPGLTAGRSVSIAGS
ncbi:RND family efflux transporter MFP subunit [Azospirillum lipoferum]|uniref:Efflux RND transporter periplasmic adaptor subunit n=1 Tax=Azospirillum lipoferum TaxID=193 RepID=A0A5A9GSD9_AZOLI|nr:MULTISPECIES: efflux RND transporter periplasmic adaptor subunit [Azospirillum]KAA0597297.1 efflux RND transporter periplasmic adaptor subunit [Azospirillum lipoferum]MCP1608820.1 RND family efflux transporter MFP subunit [Azospirillum lipoferum]MDW5535865.1 efflux RND transporter periplasmic adaptor subunit [Azospirillum sp. NL1]